MLEKRIKWTDDQIQLLKEQYSIVGTSIPELLTIRKRDSIRWKAKTLNLAPPRKENYLNPESLEAISSEKWAYLAGLIDGEGSIYISVDKRHHTIFHFLEVSISNTARSLIDWLLNEFGGTEKLSGSARRNECPEQWVWVIRGYRAEPYLKAVLPYLVIKHRQAHLALEFLVLGKGVSCPKSKSKLQAEIKAKISGLNCLKGKAR